MDSTALAEPFESAVEGAALDLIQHDSNSGVRNRLRDAYLGAFGAATWGVTGGACGGSVLVQIGEGKTRLQPAMCWSWECAACGPRKAVWLRDEIKRAMPIYELDSFQTLTIRTRGITPLESYGAASRAWNIVRTQLKREIADLRFVRVVEATKKGYAHFHVLSSAQLEAGELSRRWLNATGTSWVVDVQEATSTNVANYLAKYCAKEALERHERFRGALKGRPVYHKSRSIKFQPLRGTSEGEWRLVPLGWRAAAALMHAQAEVVREKTEGQPALEVAGDWSIGGGELVVRPDVGVARAPGVLAAEMIPTAPARSPGREVA